MTEKRKFDLLQKDDPATQWLLMTGMALGHARMFSDHPFFLLNCLATLSLARREFYAQLAERGEWMN